MLGLHYLGIELLHIFQNQQQLQNPKKNFREQCRKCNEESQNLRREKILRKNT